MDVLITGIALTIGYAFVYKTVRDDAKKQVELFKEGFQKGFEAKHGYKPFEDKKENETISSYEPYEDIEEEEEELEDYIRERWD